jgi:hypothetical protein
MQNTGGDAFRVQFHISENPGHFKGVGQVRFPGKPHLAFVNPRGINIRPFNDIQVGISCVIGNPIDYIINPDQCRSSVICYGLFVIGNRISAIRFQVSD